MNIFTLHGFLGRASDWDCVHFPEDSHVHFVDLYAAQYPDPLEGFESWVDVFCGEVDPESRNILVGYSMGGRLALHCLEQYPDLWERGVFLSTHPGLQNQQKKELRLVSDQEWAKSFENESWDKLMNRWNSQSVFGDDKIVRKESDYSRVKLANSLRGWSLGNQKDFREVIQGLNCPVAWITGESDHKFSDLARSLHFAHQESRKIVIPEGSHRLIPYLSKDFLGYS